MIYTFYSFKGGVGRSMALANVGEWLAEQGLRVVMVDWDLEAPGLESFFFEAKEDLDLVQSQLGVIDLLWAYRRMFPSLDGPSSIDAGGAEATQSRRRWVEHLTDALPSIAHALFPVHERSDDGGLWLLPAGWRAGDRFSAYAEAVQNFDWADFYANFQGEAYFEWLRGQLTSPSVADVVLIDSRTGVTEMGGVCTRQLADVVVMFSAPNAQSRKGLGSMAESFTREDLIKLRDRKLELVVVPTRVDNQNTVLKNKFEQQFGEHLDRFTPQMFKMLKTTFWELRIPYITDYSFSEKLAIGTEGRDKDLEESYKKLTAHLAVLAPGTSSLRVRCGAEIARVFGRALPSVYIAHAGGESAKVANTVRKLLEPSSVSAWPDENLSAPSSEPSAGLRATLGQCRTVVVAVTEETLSSSLVRSVCRIARERGLPVIAVAETSLSPPSWLSGGRVLQLPNEADQLLRLLEDPLPVPPTPYMVPQLPLMHVRRETEISRVQDALLADTGPVAIVGLAGAGKTVLASAVCREDDVRDGFPDGVLWVTLHEATDVEAELRRLSIALSGVALGPGEEPSLAFERVLEGRRCLVVIDDAWDARQLAVFLRGGPECKRLVTTRDEALAKVVGAAVVQIGGFSESQGETFFSARLQGTPLHPVPEPLLALGRRVEWLPLALDLVSAMVRSEARQPGGDLRAIATRLEKQFEREGLVGLEPPGLPAERSLSSAVKQLYDCLLEDERNRLAQMAGIEGTAFASSERLAHLWGIDVPRAERQIERFRELSLVEQDTKLMGARLHPLVRSWILGERLLLVDPDSAAELAYANLSTEEQQRARTLFTRLVRLARAGESAEDTVIALPLAELDDELRQLAPRLTQVGLTATNPTSDGGELLTLASPALLSEWKRLRGWISDDREFLLWRQNLRTRLADWEQSGRLSAGLITGSDLTRAQALADAHSLALSGAERAFVEASRRQARRARYQRYASVTLGLVVLTSIIAFNWYFDRRTQQRKEAAEAVRAAADLLKAGDVTQAESFYSKAIALDPTSPSGYFGRGVALVQDAKPEQAIADFTAALERSSETDQKQVAAVHLNRGLARLRLGFVQPALADFDAAASRDPDNARVWMALGEAQDKLGNPDGALQSYNTAIERDAGLAEAYFGRGTLHEELRDKAAAIADFKKVVELSSADPHLQRAAQARLEQLGVKATPITQPTRVLIGYSDPTDRDRVLELVKVLKGKFAGERRVAMLDPVPIGPGAPGQVRYFFPQDEKQAKQVQSLIEDELARRGYPLSLKMVYRDPAQIPGAEAGLIKIWLPSLYSSLSGYGRQDDRTLSK